MTRLFLDTEGFLDTKDGERIAYKRCTGADTAPTLIWCGGLKSDMDGTKAVFLHDWAARRGANYIRFDYFGHGQSSGDFIDGTISRWAADVGRVIEGLTENDVILVGSSMGGWASLLAATQHKRVKALLLINPAPDFTQKLTYAGWDAKTRAALLHDGVVYEPSDYGEPYAYSRALIEDGRARQILDAPINFRGAVRILQGAEDSVVPADYSRKILDVITSGDARYTLVKGGDHSLSRPQDLELLAARAGELLGELS